MLAQAFVEGETKVDEYYRAVRALPTWLAGKIQEDEPPQELFTNPKHPRLKAFLSKML